MPFYYSPFKLISLLLTFLLITACTKEVSLEKEKILRIRTPAAIKGFDPIMGNDLYSSNEIGRVYEGLLEFHYLKRPYQLAPLLVESLPEVSKDGLIYTFKLKKGVYFHDNICFPNGKGREFKAADIVFSLQRLADPKLQSLGWWLLDGKIKGLNQWRESNSKEKVVNYGQSIEGLKVLDDYTLQVSLVKPYPQFLYALAMPFTFIVAKEAVDYYGQEFLNNPVGTGAFITGKFTQSNKIIYKRNPNYHQVFYPSEGATGDKELGLLDSAGKKLPLVDQIEVGIVIENQPAWLSFLKGEQDLSGIPKEYFAKVIQQGDLAPQYKSVGIKSERSVGLDVTFIAFNMEDPLFKNNLKLRQAMALAYDAKKINDLFYQGLSVPAQSLVPPDIAGHDANYTNPYMQFDVVKAKKLLAEAGYPEGKGLPAINYYLTASTEGRQLGEAFRDMMKVIGITINVTPVPWTELQNLISKRQAPLFGMAWGADYPDAENFYQLLYGPAKAPGANGSNYQDAAFDKMFESSTIMPDSPERTAKYEEMYRYAGEQVPWIFGVHRVGYALHHGWVKNVKFTEFTIGIAKYYDLDLEAKKNLLPKVRSSL